MLYLIASCMVTLLGILMFMLGVLQAAHTAHRREWRQTLLYLLMALVGIWIQSLV